MSETTKTLRAFQTYSVGACGVRDRAADAIEAVEAQVAEVVARVAALEPKPAMALSAGPPEGGFRVGDRVMALDIPSNREFRGLLGTIVPCEYRPQMDRLVAVALDKDPEGLKVRTSWPVGELALVSRPEPKPAPSAVTAPRGFREGDIVRIKRTANGHEGWHGQEGPLVRDGISLRPKLRFNGIGEPLVVAFHPHEYDLVRAADAPEAPAEDAGLVERLLLAQFSAVFAHRKKYGGPLYRWEEQTDATKEDGRSAVRAVIAALTAESRLCAPGEVARLTAERDEAQGASILNANAVRLQKARAEAAEKDLAEARAISAATAERVRNETQIATELRKDLADANGARDRLVRELSGERVERDYWKTRAEDVTKERDALRAELNTLKAKPRFRTRKVTAKDVGAWEEEWCKDSYGAGERHKAMNAVGLRMRVDGAK